MAGLLSNLVGGVLEGAGAGMVKQAEQNGLATRLERLKEIEFENQQKLKAIDHENQAERDARLYGQQTERDRAQHGYRLEEVGAQGAATQANTRLSNELAAGREGAGREWEREKLRSQQEHELRVKGATAERWETITTPDGGTAQRNVRTGETKPMPAGTTAYGSPGEGLVWKRDEKGQIVKDENGAPIAVAYAGGKVAREEATANEKKNLGKDSRQKYANVVTEDIDRALGMIDEGGFGGVLPVTGTAGSVTKSIPGTKAYDVAKLIDTVKANVGFDHLQEMRASSPTGAALGSVTEKELAFLQATVGALDQSQSEEQVVYNLKRVKNVVLDTIHGVGNGPEREPVGRNDRGAGGAQSAPTNPRAAASAAPVRITNDAAGRAAYGRLPSGATFIAPDGTTRRKP